MRLQHLQPFTTLTTFTTLNQNEQINPIPRSGASL
jgi:hypothetical protein